MEFGLDIVINVGTATAPKGVNFANPNAVLLLTTEEAKTSDKDYLQFTSLKDVITEYGSESVTAKHATNIFSQSPNILYGNGILYIAKIDTDSDEKVDAAITRLSQLIYFNGILIADTSTISDADLIKAATVVQAKQNSILILADNRAESLAAEGLFDKISKQSLFRTKMIYYGLGTDRKAADLVASAFAGRAFTTNFNGVNTCISMDLKDLSGVMPDTSLTSEQLTSCKTLGVDCYPSICGIGKVRSNKSSQYFDQVYNSIWFANAIQVEYFNALAKISTKVAQTEQGITYIKNKTGAVCSQAVTNGYLAPGKWNGVDTFGNPEDFHRNIQEFGYFQYTQPIAEQSQTERESRTAPLLHIAGKEAGAIHGGSVTINFEA